MTPADARLEEARTGRPATDLRRPCGRSAGSAPALLAHACRMRSLRCSELHPNLSHLDRRISRRGLSAEAPLNDLRDLQVLVHVPVQAVCAVDLTDMLVVRHAGEEVMAARGNVDAVGPF